MTRSFGTPSYESTAFYSVDWGDPLLANLAGTTARATGDDPVSGVVRGMKSSPEGLDVRPFGSGAGILEALQLDGLQDRLPGLPAPGQDFRDVSPDSASGGALFGLLPSLPDNLGSRVGFGALGLGLVLIGAFALLRS